MWQKKAILHTGTSFLYVSSASSSSGDSLEPSDSAPVASSDTDFSALENEINVTLYL